jgi:hypothetical protein
MTFSPNGKNRWEYEPDPLGRLGQGTWRDTGLPAAEDRVPDTDAEVAAMRRAYVRGDALPVLRGGGLHVENGLGRDRANARADVARVEVALARAGHYDLTGTGGPTGWWGTPQEEALRAFQKQNGLKPTGTFDAGDATHAALTRALAANDDGGSGIRIGANDNGAGGGDGVRHAPADQTANAAVLSAGEYLAPHVARAVAPYAARFLAPLLGVPASAGLYEGADQLGLVDQVVKDFSQPLLPPDPFLHRELKLPPGALRNPMTQDAFTASPPMGPNHTGHGLPPPLVPPHTGHDMPEPIIPNHTGSPIPTFKNEPLVNVPPILDTKPWIEIFPDQSSELPQAAIWEANDGRETKQLNAEILVVARRVIKKYGFPIIHVAGGVDEEGSTVKERMVASIFGRFRSVFPDLMFFNVATGRFIDLQTIDTNAAGEQDTREADARDRLEQNRRNGDQQVAIPKRAKGQAQPIDETKLEKYLVEAFERSSAPHSGPKTPPQLWNIFK